MILYIHLMAKLIILFVSFIKVIKYLKKEKVWPICHLKHLLCLIHSILFTECLMTNNSSR